MSQASDEGTALAWRRAATEVQPGSLIRHADADDGGGWLVNGAVQQCAKFMKVAKGGWAAWAVAARDGAVVTAVDASFVVPDPPATDSKQTLFLFPAVQSNQFTIVQAVLQWGYAGQDAPFWSVASWAVTNRDCVFRTRFTRVNTGDRLRAAIELHDGNYHCEFTGVVESRLRVRPANNEVFDQAHVAFECYGVTTGAELPQSGADFSPVRAAVGPGPAAAWQASAPGPRGERAVVSGPGAGNRIQITF